MACHSVLKKLALSLFIFLSFGQTQAAQPKALDLKLSKTAKMHCSAPERPRLSFMPSFGGFWLDGSLDKKPYSVWISRKKPETLANSFSVNRFWKENLAFSKSVGDVFQDLGCQEIQPHTFRCDRTVEKSGKFAAESILWNSNSDLILVRATSTHSAKGAQKVLRQFDFKLLNRLPAGRTP